MSKRYRFLRKCANIIFYLGIKINRKKFDEKSKDDEEIKRYLLKENRFLKRYFALRFFRSKEPLDEGIINEIIKSLNDGFIFEIRRIAGITLCEIGVKIIDEKSLIGKKTLEEIKNEDEANRKLKKIVDALTNRIKNEKNHWVSERLIESIGKIGVKAKELGGDMLIDVIVERLLIGSENIVKRRAAATLGKIRASDKKVIDALLTTIKKRENEVVQTKAIWAIGDIGLEAVNVCKNLVPDLIQEMINTRRFYLKKYIAYVLGIIIDTNNENYLEAVVQIRNLMDKESDKFLYAWSLAKLEGPNSFGDKQILKMMRKGKANYFEKILYNNLIRHWESEKEKKGEYEVIHRLVSSYPIKAHTEKSFWEKNQTIIAAFIGAFITGILYGIFGLIYLLISK
ncbi:MAG: HEAT repeat domain-containing protein [Candidatus Heimdallarchaeota archaeon]